MKEIGTMKKHLLMIAALALCGAASAKLPPLSAEAKAKADEAAARTAWQGKVDAYKLCQAQDQVATRYMTSAQAAGKETKPATATPPCADPGAFAYIPAEAPKPLEASGAHSPAATATSPPSSKVPDAVMNPAQKP